MTIKIFTDRIDIGDFTLFEGNGGVQFDGVARAENFLGNQSFQGTVAGYASGGFGPATLNIIDKFPFATNSNATDVGDLIGVNEQAAGHSSAINGYNSGGRNGGSHSNIIQKFLFATDTNTTDVGDLTQARATPAGQSSTTHGYSSGGYTSNPPRVNVNTIDKFTFAVDTNATDVGDIAPSPRHGMAGQSSSTHGYYSGGEQGPGIVNNMGKFPFAIDSSGTDIADLTQARNAPAGQSSTTHGYASGGFSVNPPFTVSNIIDKFPFATDTNATDVGDLTQAKSAAAGQSSTVSGYSSGGYSPGRLNTIDKFPFASDTNATDIGDLTQGRSDPSEQQV